ncbi:MAG: LCP family protein [Bacilli bacterium]
MKKIKSLNICLIISIIICILSSTYLIYNILLFNNIEGLIRYIVIFIIGIINIGLLFLVIKRIKKKYKNIGLIILIIIFSFILNTFSIVLNYVYNLVDNINKDYVTYSTSLVAKYDFNDKVIVNKKIGMITNKSSIDGYILGNKLLKDNKLTSKNELLEYDDFPSLLADLYDNVVDLIIIPSNYVKIFGNLEKYEHLGKETKIIKTITDKRKKDNEIIKPSNKKLMDPFTILLMGVDSTDEVLEKDGAFNGDSLMLVTFNPKTLNSTILSFPRDTYVPISCFNGQIEHKINSAAWQGSNCMIKTIENFTSIKIDYYMKMNFKGLVGLVNAIGGIEVNVPKKLCTDDSNRGGEICINEGLQTLNGEEALVLSRNRYDFIDGDISRGKNQQLVLQGILNKAKNIRSITTFNKILNTVINNVDTNMSVDQILSFYNIGKDIMKNKTNTDNVLNMEQLSLSGTGQMIYDEMSRLVLWNYIYNKDSLTAITNEMKINLGLMEKTLIKDFNYSINNPYTKTVIGFGYYNTVLYPLLPDFTTMNKLSIDNWANKNNMTVQYKYINNNEPSGTIISQSIPNHKRMDKIDKSIPIIIEISNQLPLTKIDCSLESNKENKQCLVPNFTKMSKQSANEWFLKFAKLEPLIFNDLDISLYPDSKSGTIVSQSITSKTHLKDLITNKISIELGIIK